MNSAADGKGMTPENPGDPGTLLFENDQVRIWELIMEPGEMCLWHDHPYPHILIVLNSGKREALMADGTLVSSEGESNVVALRGPSKQPEIARNMDPEQTFRELIIDLKIPPDSQSEALARSGNKTSTDVSDYFQYVKFFQPGTATTALPHGSIEWEAQSN